MDKSSIENKCYQQPGRSKNYSSVSLSQYIELPNIRLLESNFILVVKLNLCLKYIPNTQCLFRDLLSSQS